jgi:uncharacterized protein YggU (UPF0235/DUF167 family)
MKASADWVQDTSGGVSLQVRVIPRAGATKIAGVRDGRLLVRLAAAPVEGAANDALVSALAALLRIPSRAISVMSGARGRNKVLALAGVDAARVREAITRASGQS